MKSGKSVKNNSRLKSAAKRNTLNNLQNSKSNVQMVTTLYNDIDAQVSPSPTRKLAPQQEIEKLKV